jgi:hypothetical protein
MGDMGTLLKRLKCFASEWQVLITVAIACFGLFVATYTTHTTNRYYDFVSRPYINWVKTDKDQHDRIRYYLQISQAPLRITGKMDALYSPTEETIVLNSDTAEAVFFPTPNGLLPVRTNHYYPKDNEERIFEVHIKYTDLSGKHLYEYFSRQMFATATNKWIILNTEAN